MKQFFTLFIALLLNLNVWGVSPPGYYARARDFKYNTSGCLYNGYKQDASVVIAPGAPFMGFNVLYNGSDSLPINSGVYEIKVNVTSGANAATLSLGDFTITAVPLTINRVVVRDTVYNGNTTAAVTEVHFTGLVGDETLALGTDYTVNSANFTTAIVGENKTVTIEVSLVEGDNIAKNYTLASGTYIGTTDAKITKRQLTIEAPAVEPKVYDGNRVATAASVKLGDVVGIATGDEVVVEVDSARFDNADAGENKTVVVVYKLSGSGSDNYTAPVSSVVNTGKIVPDTVVVTPNARQSKIYGDNEPKLTYSTDPANLIADNSFRGALSRNDTSNHNVGTYAITQGDLSAGNNYVVRFVPDSVFAITKRPIFIDSVTVAEKYKQGGGLEAMVTEVVFDNLVNNDSLKLDIDYRCTVLFVDANVGTGKAVSVTITLQNTGSANNYAINFVTGRVFIIEGPQTGTPRINQTLEYQHFPFVTLEEARQAMPIKLTDTTDCGLRVHYTSGNEDVAVVEGDSVLIVVGAGSAVITASNDGNSSYNPLNVEIIVNVGDPAKQYQEITWNQTLTRAVGDTVVLKAKATSGLPIRYISSNILVAIIENDSVLVVVGAGSAEITASQSGNDNWNPALKVVQTYATVSDPAKKSQSILWNQTLDYSLNDQEVMLTAKATSGLPVRYTSDNLNVAMVVGNKLIFIDAGQAIITAIQDGNDTINPAPVEQLVLTVGDPDKQNQTIVWNQTLNTTYKGNNPGSPHYITLNATAGSGLGIVYRSSNTDIAVIVNKEVVIVGPGQAIITATQEGDQRYNPAPAVQRILTVGILGKTDQTITWEQTLESSDADNSNTIVLEATVESGLSIRYLSSNTKVATIKDDNVLTIEGKGLAIITATQPGNDNYNPAPVVSKVFVTADYTFDTCVTTMYCNFFMLRLRTLRTVLNANNQTLGRDTVIILHARWYLDGDDELHELREGVTPEGEFITGYGYSAGKKTGSKLADGTYHFVLHVREVYSDGRPPKELDIRSGDRIVAGCSTTASTKLVVYPNPGAGSRSIFVRAALDASPRADNAVRIYSVSNGTLVKEVQRLSEITEVTLSVAPGTYSVQTGGEQVKIVIQK